MARRQQYNEYDDPDLEREALLSQMSQPQPKVNAPTDRSAPGPADYAPPASAPSGKRSDPVGTPGVPPATTAAAAPPPTPTGAWNPATMTQGWNMDKWNDPTHQTVKYLAGRYMATMAPTSQNLAKVADYLKQQGYSVSFDGADAITLSGKELTKPVTIDAIQGLKGGNPMWNWLDASGGSAPGAAGSAGAASGPGGSSGLSPSGPNTQPYAGFTDPATNEQFKDYLSGLFAFDPSKVTLDSPGLRPQSDAISADLQRARRDKQAGLAEMYSQQGLGESGAMDADIASSFDKMGQDIATADSELIANEVKAQRDQMMQALAMYGGLLSDDQRNALSWKIAQMEDYISRLQIGYNYDSLEGNLNNDAIRILLGA